MEHRPAARGRHQVCALGAVVVGLRGMNHTAFPATPADVATLTVQEFTFDCNELDGNRVVSMDRVCRAFTGDVNRALVWWIRFGALKNWCAGPSASASWVLRDACEVAAGFPLNDFWEFDPRDFAVAVESVAVRRARTER